MDNARLLLQIDNTKLAQDDFKNKYVSRRTLLSDLKRGLWRAFRQVPDLIFESELFFVQAGR